MELFSNESERICYPTSGALKFKNDNIKLVKLGVDLVVNNGVELTVLYTPQANAFFSVDINGLVTFLKPGRYMVNLITGFSDVGGATGGRQHSFVYTHTASGTLGTYCRSSSRTLAVDHTASVSLILSDSVLLNLDKGDTIQHFVRCNVENSTILGVGTSADKATTLRIIYMGGAQ